jgi:hypothetical protein
MTGIRYDCQSYYAGYVAGLVGRANIVPRETRDPLAWYSAFIEGQAVRLSGALRFPRWRPPGPLDPPVGDAWPVTHYR